jgi:hypothetical protein
MDGRSFLKFVIDAEVLDLPPTVVAHLAAEQAAGVTWRDTHYIKHNSVGAGNYPTKKAPNCGARPHTADDVHFVDRPDNNFIAIRHLGTADSTPSKYTQVYRDASSVSSNFLYAEFNWNNNEQFKGGKFNGSLPLEQHLGTNNRMGGWADGWSNSSESSPGNVNFTEPFFFELFDMATDPLQMVNIYTKVAEAEPAVVAAMHEHVHQLHVCQGQSCP